MQILVNETNRTHKLEQQLDLSRMNETIKLCDSMLDNTTPTDTQKTGSLDCTACSQETKQMTGAVRAGTPRARSTSPRNTRQPQTVKML
ncbi:hypothetical protein EVAR_101013_1 [Eumeta japonica]|uniref:Uncharacterized protein n=1 Tax=Eumeta variegata TaxID=151549 RepID=A0A4C1ZY14_EUMVA|nr:hypothetical protein EVAR_101013_1 [Eumeta japonica]